MSIYLDASVLVPLIVAEPSSAAAQQFVSRAPEPIMVSDFAAAEVASAVSRLVRTARLSADAAGSALDDFDTWRAAAAQDVDLASADARLAGVCMYAGSS